MYRICNITLAKPLKSNLHKQPTVHSLHLDTGVLVVALADYEAADGDQLTLVAGEKYIMLVEDYGNGWALGTCLDGSLRGVFPQTFVEKLTAGI
eukprot:jgi/Hompol1/5410/HPOL_001992-RA